MVERRGGFSETAILQKEVNRLFEQLAQLERRDAGVELGEWSPSVDVFETGTHLVLKIEAPGISAGDLSVVFRGHKLVVSGEKREVRDEKPVEGYLCLERSFGKFTRSIYIDEAVDLNRARAELAQGVLTISMPRLKDRRGNEIRLAVEERE